MHIFHMMNMNVIMVGDGCRGVCRVRRGVLEWDNNQKSYLGMWMGVDMRVLCGVWPGKFPGCHAWVGEGSEGVRPSARMIRDG